MESHGKVMEFYYQISVGSTYSDTNTDLLWVLEILQFQNEVIYEVGRAVDLKRKHLAL